MPHTAGRVKVLNFASVHVQILHSIWYDWWCRTSDSFKNFPALTARLSTSFGHRTIWVVTRKKQQNECAPSEDSDQPGHPPSLIRVFAVGRKKAWVLSYPLSALPEPKRRFIAQSLSCSPFHRLEMTEILSKGRKTLTHPSIKCTAKTLIRLGGYPGWFESSLGAQSLCWFCHVAAHMLNPHRSSSGIIIHFCES